MNNTLTQPKRASEALASLRSGLVAVTLDEDQGGIAQVALHLKRAFGNFSEHAPKTSQYRPTKNPGTLVDRLRLTTQVHNWQWANKVDWLFFDHLHLVTVQNLLPKFLQKPYGVFLHGIEAWPAMTPARKKAVKNATVRISNSQCTADRTLNSNPEIGPIDVCPLCLPNETERRLANPSPHSQENRNAVNQKFGWKDDDLVVMIVGRLSQGEQYKGHDPLIECWSEITDAVPGARFVVVGSGDDEQRLKEKAAQTSEAAKNNIHFAGFVDTETLDFLYQRSDIYCMPSRGEGFGLVYLEAMAYGLPCIGSIHDAANESIVDGKNGFLVDLDNKENLPKVLIQLLKDDELRKKMGNAGKDRLKEKFTFSSFQKRLEKILVKAFGSSS